MPGCKPEVNDKLKFLKNKLDLFKGETSQMESKQQDRDQEYISISEFARATGRSRTTVYKYLDSFLSKYVQDVQGKKVVSKAAIEAFKSIDVEKVVQEGCSYEHSDCTENCLDGQMTEQLNGQVEQLIEALKEQLRVKDEQIRAKDQQIESLHEILSRQQQLAAIQEQRIIKLTANEPETATTVEHEGSEEDPAASQQKKGLFRRIWEALTED